MSSRGFGFIIFLLVAAFFGCFLAYPIWSVLSEAFISSKGKFTLDYIWEIFRNPLYREGLENSFWIALGTTLGCLLLSVPLAIVSVRYRFPGKTVLNSLLLAPMILPPFVGAIGVRAMLGQAGAVNSLLMSLGLMNPDKPTDWLGHGQFYGVVLMNILHLYPILFLNVSAALANLDPAMEEAAANLGCPPQMRFWRITMPLIMPGLFAGGSLVFIWAFTELGVPLIFDYTRVTSVQIFNALKDINGNPYPYALVAVMLIATTVIYLVSKFFFGRSVGLGGGRATTGREDIQLSKGAGLLCSGVFALCIFLAILPHLGVLLLSLSTDWYRTVLPEHLTLQHFNDALSNDLTLTAVSNSLKYATLATVLDLVFGIGIAYVCVRTKIWGRQLLDTIAMMPLAVPGLVLAFGYLSMVRPDRPFHWLMLGENPFFLLVIAYSVRRLPYVVRSATAGFEQVNVSLEEAAQNLGSSPLQTLKRITLPLIAPNLIAGGLLAFSFAMLEVSDSLIIAQQAGHYPITKAIYALVTALGDGPMMAAALGVWAMIFLGVTLLGASIILGKKLGTLFRA